MCVCIYLKNIYYKNFNILKASLALSSKFPQNFPKFGDKLREKVIYREELFNGKTNNLSKYFKKF